MGEAAVKGIEKSREFYPISALGEYEPVGPCDRDMGVLVTCNGSCKENMMYLTVGDHVVAKTWCEYMLICTGIT